MQTEKEKWNIKENITENLTHSIEGILESIGVNGTKGEKNEGLLKILRHRKNGFIPLYLNENGGLLGDAFISSLKKTAYLILCPPLDYDPLNQLTRDDLCAYTIEKVVVQDDIIYLNEVKFKKDIPEEVYFQNKKYIWDWFESAERAAIIYQEEYVAHEDVDYSEDS